MTKPSSSKSLVGQAIAGNRPGRSVFDLTYSHITTCEMGQLVPMVCDEMVPGDELRIRSELVIRMQPLIAPCMHEIRAYMHYWYVPYRLLDEDWELIITGGPDGLDDTPVPTWEPTTGAGAMNGVGSLWDYLGFPPGVDPDGAYPMDYPRRAYNLVYNEWYRDQNLIAEVPLSNESVLNRAYHKDYFTSALPWLQRGVAPALPLSGLASVSFDGDVYAPLKYDREANDLTADRTAGNAYFNTIKTTLSTAKSNKLIEALVPKSGLDLNEIDMSTVGTFTLTDLRYTASVQRALELSARAGVRYTEFLSSVFGVRPLDSRLQRPEYIGGASVPVIISEVLQSSQTDETPQGTMAGHGLGVDAQKSGRYHAEEYGLIIGILSIMPAPMYQQGIDRQWLRRSRYDFYRPEFACLSEQGIEMAEIYATDVAVDNREIFGFSGRFDEMRIKRNRVSGLMRTDLKYWHLGRIFDSAPELNQLFVECDSVTGGASNPLKRIFSYPAQPGFYVVLTAKITAVRPIPVVSIPGRLDHVYGGT